MNSKSSREIYLDAIFGEGSGSASGYNRLEKQEEALKYAHEMRRFEIDLFWKRSAHFWIFISLAFLGYGSLIHLQVESEPRINQSLLSLLSVALTAVGFLLSFWWWMANKGSRYWQEVWEKNIDYLEDEITGKLYKTLVYKNRISCKDKILQWLNPVSACPFSVSKINIAVSFFITLIWFVLFILSAFGVIPNGDLSWVELSIGITATIIVVGAIVVLALLSCCCLKSDHAPPETGSGDTDLDNDWKIHQREPDP